VSRRRHPRQDVAGFSLVEVMVALIVVSVGLLGLAKMATLALASTTVASQRSLATIEASSLASMMHANQDFWQGSAAFTSLSISGNMPFPAQNACTQAQPCAPQSMAQGDLNIWANALYGLIPSYSAQITCTTLAGTAPVSCTIGITWAENAVAMNSQQTNQTGMAGLNGPTYILYVQP